MSPFRATGFAFLPILLALATPANASATEPAGTVSGAAKTSAKATDKPTSAGRATSRQAKSLATRPVRKSTTATKKRGTNTAKTTQRRMADGGAAGDTVAAEAPCYRPSAGRGRCEPQCLPYTRCRSGIESCRTGHGNGPVTWFRCEQDRGNTALQPAEGNVLVLGRNAHNMPTGHTLYVEKAKPRSDGRYELTLSHTNYDRRCNLETNMVADYDPATKTIDVHSGHWAPWGHDLKVAGFILN